MKNKWRVIIIRINTSIVVVIIMAINVDIMLLIITVFATIIDASEIPSSTRHKTQPQTQDVKNWISKTKH